MVKDTLDVAASTIQKHIRGFLARKHFALKDLDKTQQTLEKTMIVGNDPVLPDLSAYKTDEKIALIGTSGMRNLAIACEIASTKQIPKIIIVDISENVCNFWRNFRSFMTEIKSEHTFHKELPYFLDKNKHLYTVEFDEKYLHKPEIIPDAFGNNFLNQNSLRFFEQLIKQHGFEMLRKITLHTSVIKQNWADLSVFSKLKNILTLNGIQNICMYPSNIVACTNELVGIKVLQNIRSLKPIFTIHTNACLFHSRAEKTYLITDQSPDSVKQKIFEPSHPNHTTKDLVKLQLAELGIASANNNDGDSNDDIFEML